MARGLTTPTWIQDHIDAHGGGWAHPIEVSEGHPLIGWSCFCCEQRVDVLDVAIIMPFHGDDEDRWVAYHRSCLAKQILG